MALVGETALACHRIEFQVAGGQQALGLGDAGGHELPVEAGGGGASQGLDDGGGAGTDVAGGLREGGLPPVVEPQPFRHALVQGRRAVPGCRRLAEETFDLAERPVADVGEVIQAFKLALQRRLSGEGGLERRHGAGDDLLARQQGHEQMHLGLGLFRLEPALEHDPGEEHVQQQQHLAPVAPAQPRHQHGEQVEDVGLAGVSAGVGVHLFGDAALEEVLLVLAPDLGPVIDAV